jgi:hypothetical protein
MAGRPNRVERWHHKPQRLSSGKEKPWQLILNVALLLLASLFFVYAGLVAKNDGSPPDKVTWGVYQTSHFV